MNSQIPAYTDLQNETKYRKNPEHSLKLTLGLIAIKGLNKSFLA